MKIIALICSLYFFIPIKAPNNIPQKFTGKVIKIVDGDTFDVLTDNKETVRIRMNGIDCPERKQAYYQVCKDMLSAFIFGKNVVLISNSKDRYRRVLADVYFENRNINLLMIQKGFAWHYKKYSKDEEMAKAEIEARKAKIGLWKNADAIAPWIFKREQIQKKK